MDGRAGTLLVSQRPAALAVAIHYATGEAVMEGDHVAYRSRVFFWHGERRGRISHVPGISKPHEEMAFGGMRWVGVSGDDGTFRGASVDPKSEAIPAWIKFIGRSDGTAYLTPDQIPSGEW